MRWEGQIILQFWLESSNSQKQMLTQGTPKGGRGFSPPMGPSGGDMGTRPRTVKGEGRGARAGWDQAQAGLHPVVAGREELGTRSSPPLQGTSAQSPSSFCPILAPQGHCLFSASCSVPWQSARSRAVVVYSLPCLLGPEVQGPDGKDVADQRRRRGKRQELGMESGEAVTSHFLFLASVAASVKQY